MNCQEYRNLIEDALDVSLHGEPERRVRLHLEHCASCRDYFKLRRDEHIALFSRINLACEELHLPDSFSDRLVESVMNRRSARRGRRRLSLPKWALIAASLVVMLGFAFAATVAVEAVLGGGEPGEREGTKATEGAEATAVEVADVAAIDPSAISVPLVTTVDYVSSSPSTQTSGNEFETNIKGETRMNKVKAATAALTAAFAAAPLAAANGDGGYQFIISGDPVAAETVGSSSDSSVASALNSGTLAGGVVLDSAFETRYCTWQDSPARSLRSDKCCGVIIYVF